LVNIEVNGKATEARAGETILTVLKRLGIKVPALCHLEGLPPTGACRMCVVEVDGRLLPSCSQPVADGMKVRTHAPRVMRARKTIVELLLASHPDDCLYCERNGQCTLQGLAQELGVRQRRYSGAKNSYKADVSNPSIVRDPAKCILCGKCVRVCGEVQSVAAIDFIGRGSRAMIGTVFNRGLNVSSCVDCGQCVMVCPTGALREQSHIKEVNNALNDPARHVVVQHAPSVSVTLAEEFGLKPGTDVCGTMTAVLRRMGFDRIFDTAFAADLTIMEEASELVHRISTGGPLPLLTSCSPGWVKFIEQFYPDFIPNVSTCKSPQQMMGAVIKSFYAERSGIDPRSIYSVSIMPCTAKKFEAQRPEMARHGVPDIDAVLTTRELVQMIRTSGLNLKSVEPEAADSPFGERSTAGKIFGVSGGVVEAAVRTAHHLLTGCELPRRELKSLRGFDPIKEAHLKIGRPEGGLAEAELLQGRPRRPAGLEVGVIATSGLGNARKVLDEIRAGRRDIHFVEVMTCPGGCIAGGGQPHGTDRAAVRKRMQALYKIDRTEQVRTSHGNQEVQRLYREFLGRPLGELSHHLLHTHYAKRESAC
jgi:NADH-quinone oxidoreductase subunit G/NADP-reducing hydrogenase subunit HndD